MKTISAIAAALSLVTAVALAPVANAATAPKASTPAAACSSKDKKHPCPVKHMAKATTHKHKIAPKKASAEPTKTATKKAS